MNNINDSKILQSVFTPIDQSRITYTNLQLKKREVRFYLDAVDQDAEFSLTLMFCFDGVANFPEGLTKSLGDFDENIKEEDVPTGYYVPINATDFNGIQSGDWYSHAIGGICAKEVSSLIFELNKDDSEWAAVKCLMSIGGKTFSMELEFFDINLEDLFIF